MTCSAATRCVGERDPRSEDRQLLLDAVLAAREHLVVLYTGADARTSAPRPPAVPLGEILDAARRHLRAAPDGRGRDDVVVRHPLQPFDAAQLHRRRAWHDWSVQLRPASLAGARALPRAGPTARSCPRRCHACRTTSSPSTTLVWFLEQPARGFLAAAAGRDDHARRARSSPTLCRSSSTASRSGPSATGCLQPGWRAPPRTRRARRVATRDAAARRARRARGRRGRARSTALVAAAGSRWRTGRRSTSSSICVGGDSSARSTTSTKRAVRVEYSRLAPRHRLRAWAQLLALSASHPAAAWRSRFAGAGSGHRSRRRRRAAAGRASCSRSSPPSARAACASRCSWRSSRPPYASSASGAARPGRRSRCAGRWGSEADQRSFGEYDDRFHRLVWGDESSRGWPAAPPTQAPMALGAAPVRPARAAPVGAALASEEWDGVTVETVRRVRAAAPGHDRPGGKRRHRQDVHHRRARRPLRRRGRNAVELMLVTFSRDATPSCASGCASVCSAPSMALADPPRPGRRTTRYSGCSRSCDDQEHSTPRRRRGALATFDAATIATTHGFCHQMLAGLGIAGDLDTEARSSRIDDLVRGRRSTCTCASTAGPPPAPAFGFGSRCRSCTRRDRRRSGRLVPADAVRSRPRPAALGIAARCAPRSTRRKRARRLFDYDDLLTRLRDALRDPDTRADAQARIGPATGSCWSTSSRTPTRCSGRSCGPRSTATPRSC